jgi:hypothetical protein
VVHQSVRESEVTLTDILEPVQLSITLSGDWVTIDGFLDWLLNLLDNFTALDYILHFTFTHRLVFSVALLGSGFQRPAFLRFRAYVLAGLRAYHANLIL